MLVKPGHIEKLCRMAEDNSLFMFSFKIKYSWIAILTLIPGVIAVYPGEAGHYERGMEDVTDYHHLRTSITISEQVSLSPHIITISEHQFHNLLCNEQYVVSSPFWRVVGDLCHSIC